MLGSKGVFLYQSAVKVSANIMLLLVIKSRDMGSAGRGNLFFVAY